MNETGLSSPALIVDANIALWAVLPVPQGAQANRRFKQWADKGIRIMAPAWWLAECTTGIRRTSSTGNISDTEARQALVAVFKLGVETAPIDQELCESALEWSERIQQSRAYDAFYLALAERENAEFWTADKRLANAAKQAGADWVHWIGE
jgi:predicted nucleic acid-binding protein